MGQKLVDTCDIFKTLQPKGLRTIYVKVWEEGQTPGAIDTVLVENAVAVGERGKKRVVRIAKNATEPYGGVVDVSSIEAEPPPPTKRGASDA